MSLSDPSVALSWLLTVTALGAAVARAPWRGLDDDPAAHVWCGGVLALVGLWSLGASTALPPELHLLGIAAYTMVVGPALALCGGAAAVIATLALGDAGALAFGPTYLANVIVPVAVTHVVVRLTRWSLPPEFMVIVFVQGWMAGALSLAARDAFALAIAAIPSFAHSGDAWVLVACLAACEAMLTGVILTVFLVQGPPALGVRAWRRGHHP